MTTDTKPLQASGESGHLWIEDIREDVQVRGRYLVKVKRLGTTRKGDPFLSITLADRTGEVEARMWDGVEAVSPLFGEGDVVDIAGIASSYRDQIQITLSVLEVAREAWDPGLFLEATSQDIPEMVGRLQGILGGMESVPLRKLVERFLSDRDFMSLFRQAPAAKNFHHNYIGGLLEHTLSVCQTARSMTAHYPQLDGDLLLAGAFLHDIGKVRELKFDRLIDYTDEGRLLGHLALGASMLEEKLKTLKGFPNELGLRLKHLILSHHGEYAFGSPKRPKFLEAFALHLIDDLDAKLNGLGRFMDRDRQEGHWTEFNRLFERYLLKGEIPGSDQGDTSHPASEERQKPLFR